MASSARPTAGPGCLLRLLCIIYVYDSDVYFKPGFFTLPNVTARAYSGSRRICPICCLRIHSEGVKFYERLMVPRMLLLPLGKFNCRYGANSDSATLIIATLLNQISEDTWEKIICSAKNKSNEWLITNAVFCKLPEFLFILSQKYLTGCICITILVYVFCTNILLYVE